jgi:hypothetical protein
LHFFQGGNQFKINIEEDAGRAELWRVETLELDLELDRPVNINTSVQNVVRS